MKRLKTQVLAFLAFFALSPLGEAGEARRNLERPLIPFKASDAYGYVKTLASPEFAGRLTGHEGYTAAAKWAARTSSSNGDSFPSAKKKATSSPTHLPTPWSKKPR